MENKLISANKKKYYVFIYVIFVCDFTYSENICILTKIQFTFLYLMGTYRFS